MKIKVEDISKTELLGSEYDLAFFSLGYEPRCTYVPNIIDNKNISKCIIFTYSENQDSDNRKEALIFFKKKWKDSEMLELSHSNVANVYETLSNNLNSINKNDISILVDYSSMSRNWYAAILNYLTQQKDKNILLTLVYSKAKYPLKSSGFYNFELGDIKILPGCEGQSMTKKRKASIFMLGFDEVGPHSFYNLLEPDICFGVIASPGVEPNYEHIALDKNKNFIEHHLNNGQNLLKLPMSSLDITFEYLCQIVKPLNKEYNISIIQFGPKPHIIASILIGLLFKNVSCIYSEYFRSKPFDVVSNGEIIVSNVLIRNL